MDSATLTVGGLPPHDAGRGAARVSPPVMTNLDLDPGDIVEVTGRRTTVARVLPGYSTDRPDVVRIDGTVRANANVAVDDAVTVRKTDSHPAERIVLAPPENVYVRGIENYATSVLRDRPFVRGDAVRLELFGGPFVFIVATTTPKGPVVVTESTRIVVREDPLSSAELAEAQGGLPEVTYEDIGGLTDELDQIRETVELPLRHPELFRRLGIDPPRGVLLYGPPGTGKTLIAKTVANEVDAHFVSVSGPEFISKYYGESEAHLRELFEEASENAPSIVFIDELDAIAPSRERVTGEVERRIVAQLLSLMDGLETRGDVIVIGATNRGDAVDPALRRGGRFDREIEIGVPDRDGREEILVVHTRGVPLADDVDLGDLANRTHGFVGADLASLVREAAMAQIRHARPALDLEADVIPATELETLSVTAANFEEALRRVTPSAMRELFVDVPDVTFEDVGGLDDVMGELRKAVEWPLRYPALFARFSTDPPKGVLLYGPPGTGKTLLAKAVANASEANFISVKGPELLDKYVGESERAVRELFAKARQNAPTVVFLDEIDAIAPERGGDFDSRVTERVVSQLLTELDGIEELEDVLVVGATNRPDMLDRALLRPGRLEKLIHVAVPNEAARREIFAIHTHGTPLGRDVDLDALAARTDGYTGGDIEAICREAGMFAMEAFIAERTPEEAEADAEEAVVGREHFERALDVVVPSVTDEVRVEYEALAERLGGRLTGPTALDLGFQ